MFAEISQINFISVIFNHPDTSTGRGRNFVDKDKLKLLNCNFSKLISASIFHSKFILRLKRNYDAFFRKLLHHLIFHQTHAGVKLKLQPAQTRGSSFKKWAPPASHHILSWGFNGIKHQNWNVDFHKIRGFLPRNFVSQKTDLFRNPWKVLEYECCTETKDFLQLKRHMMWVHFIFSKQKTYYPNFQFEISFLKFLPS